ncbi:hypothetical protein A1O1_01206 [Capronia coronata CBS 617.96]|uniref:Acyl-CoA thioesterase II n=1 Tax=Capronia coronata CBS 617.96 TaxID=1182541 RepID=W9Z299_9EURO|nr:uncharacterized protein A1O1_01206 [Capronia coronata CBS 617.96]EXJ96080.1 hypothetical protein A1O1_01206 [Capronia coronata CBS 617.96]
MAQAAAAAYKTVPEGFALDSLQTHFMLAPDATKPLVYRVQRLSYGRRFAVRLVTIEQDQKACVTITTSFMNNVSWTGQAMKYEVAVKMKQRIDEMDITLDDFEATRTSLGPFMKSERLPLMYEVIRQRNAELTWCIDLIEPRDPSTTIAPVIAQIDPPIKSSTGSPGHILAIIHLSDYHVMDCPLSIHGVEFGLWKIGDHTKTPTTAGMKIMTSLNHTVHFHVHDDFRADELVYIEVTSPWARDGRAMIHSRIYSKRGLLIATCVQEHSVAYSTNPEAVFPEFEILGPRPAELYKAGQMAILRVMPGA